MVSEVAICNLALGNIRARTINSFTENSVQAQQCSLRYPIVRDRLLAEIPWQFARKLEPLNSTSDTIFNWAYVYNYPINCLHINRLVGSYEELASGSSDYISRLLDSRVLTRAELRKSIPYEIFMKAGLRLVGSNQPGLYVDYMSREENSELFSNDFVLALSHLLASEIAIPIVGGDLGIKLRRESLQIYKNYLSSAIVKDLNDHHIDQAESEFVTIRN